MTVPAALLFERMNWLQVKIRDLCLWSPWNQSLFFSEAKGGLSAHLVTSGPDAFLVGWRAE